MGSERRELCSSMINEGNKGRAGRASGRQEREKRTGVKEGEGKALAQQSDKWRGEDKEGKEVKIRQP